MSHVNLRRVKYGRYVSLAAKINLIYLLSLCVTWGYISVSILLPLGGSDSSLPSVWENQVRSLVWEDPLEKGMATHYSILARKIPWMEEEPGRLHTMRLQRVGHDWTTLLSFSSYCPQDYNACFFVKVFVFHDFFFFLLFIEYLLYDG